MISVRCSLLTDNWHKLRTYKPTTNHVPVALFALPLHSPEKLVSVGVTYGDDGLANVNPVSFNRLDPVQGYNVRLVYPHKPTGGKFLFQANHRKIMVDGLRASLGVTVHELKSL